MSVTPEGCANIATRYTDLLADRDWFPSRAHIEALRNMVRDAGLALSASRGVVLNEAATIAENVKGGYTANVRSSADEPELVPDPDGPWVLNSDVAKAIRAALYAQSDGIQNGVTAK